MALPLIQALGNIDYSHFNSYRTVFRLFIVNSLKEVQILFLSEVLSLLWFIHIRKICPYVALTAHLSSRAAIALYSAQFSCSVMSYSLWPHVLPHARLSCPLPTLGTYSNSCPLTWWCHQTISSSVIPFSSSLQSFTASGSVLMSHFFASGGHSIGTSASASVLPMNIQDWFPLGLTGLISWESKGLSRVFYNTTVEKHQFFGAQLSL